MSGGHVVQDSTTGEWREEPCDCPAYHAEYNDHTEKQHTACRGHLSTGDLCGGCDDCLSMMAVHYAQPPAPPHNGDGE